VRYRRPGELAAAERAYRARDLDAAARHCQALIEQDSRHCDALHLLGVVCLDRARLADAVGYLTRAARERPDDARVNYNLGTALLGLKLYEQATVALGRADALWPCDAGTLNNLGNALAGAGRHDEAIACYRQILEVDAAHVPARFNLGRSLAALDRPDAAVDVFQMLLAGAAGDVDVDADRLADLHLGLAEALVALGRHDEALAACRDFAALRPRLAEWHESLVLLLLGRYDEGWQKYESRWGIADHGTLRADARVPTLTEVAGRRVLLTPEQGLGDMIQFARYVPLLTAQGATVILQTFYELKTLMRTLDGVERVVAAGELEPQADIVTPLFSLPLVFGTRLDSIPTRLPIISRPGSNASARVCVRASALPGAVRSTIRSARCRWRCCCPC
jgi:tetratricopeptide (TPR) repeat protein